MGRRSGGGGFGGGGFGRSSAGKGSWSPWSRSRSSSAVPSTDNKKSSSPAADKPLKNPPKPAAPAPTPAPVQSQPAAGGLGSAFADGMAFGSGNAVGHRVTDAVLGPRVFRHEVTAADPAPPSAGSSTVPASCGSTMTAFQECLNSNGGNLSKCQFYMDMVCECRRSSTTGLNA